VAPRRADRNATWGDEGRQVPTIREAWKDWVAGAETGVVLTRSKDRYKPSTLRGYRQAMQDVILPELGPMHLNEVRRSDLQRLAERQRKKGKGASTVRNTLLPVRAVYRRAIQLEDVTVNPTLGLELPASRGRRERVASPAEAAKLLAALPEGTGLRPDTRVALQPFGCAGPCQPGVEGRRADAADLPRLPVYLRVTPDRSGADRPAQPR